MSQHVAVEQAENKVGTKYALIRESAGTWGVWVLRGNYAGHVRGGISFSWRVCGQKMAEGDARALYARRLMGKSKRVTRRPNMSDDRTDQLLAALRKELAKHIGTEGVLVLERRALNPHCAKCKVCAKSLWSAAVYVAGCCSRECYATFSARGR
jgi:hypothetical protein